MCQKKNSLQGNVNIIYFKIPLSLRLIIYQVMRIRILREQRYAITFFYLLVDYKIK